MTTREQISAEPANEAVKALSFADFKLLPEVAEAIRERGFETPTAVQSATYNEIMSGRDIIAMAQTGTGKTAAFGIPMAQKLDPNRRAVQGLVLAPTRELALQVTREVDEIGAKRGIRCAAVYGGASFTKQVEEVSAGAQIVAGTPGRVLDHIRRGTISFGGVKMLVLDEADEMLSMGFEKEISEIIEALPKQRQTLLFSATIPDDIQRLSKRYMGEAIVVSVSGDVVGAKEVSHFVYLVSGLGRTNDLLRVIEAEKPSSAIVFCNTRDETQAVARHLNANGLHAEWLNSDLNQSERERVMKMIREDSLRFLVATDVAARGIDISHISHVINYTFPESLEVYIHRTGRTGRMGREGAAISLIAPQDIGNLYFLRLTYKIFPVEKRLPDATEARAKNEFAQLDALRAAFGQAPSMEYAGLAERLVRDVHGPRVLSNLLSAYFARNPLEAEAQSAVVPRNEMPFVDDRGADNTATLKVKAHVAPHSVQPPPPELESEESERFIAPEQVDAIAEICPRWEESQVDSIPPEHDRSAGREKEIYVDAGRKDGLRITHLMSELERLSGLPRTAVGKVRMLTRSTFIGVPDEHFQQVLEAAGKIEIDGRRLAAEPAKES